jgi:hypothetical protein
MTFLYAVGGSLGVLYALKLGLPTGAPLLVAGALYYTFALLLSWSADVHAFLLAKDTDRTKPSIDGDFA